MSIAESIAPHLPYLRRYARSLSGSQSSGDNYVAAVLEALIEHRGDQRPFEVGPDDHDVFRPARHEGRLGVIGALVTHSAETIHPTERR